MLNFCAIKRWSLCSKMLQHTNISNNTHKTAARSETPTKMRIKFSVLYFLTENRAHSRAKYSLPAPVNR